MDTLIALTYLLIYRIFTACTWITVKDAMCFRSLSVVDSDQQHSPYSDYLQLSHGQPGARPQSGCASELHQVVDAVSTSPAVPRTVKTRRSKKLSKAAGYAFADPLSKATRSLNLSKLARSEFDWRTLTAIRPTTELEERFITRLVEIERLQVLHHQRMHDHHHSFTFSLQAQNLPIQQILPTLTFLLYPWTAFIIMGLHRTYHAHQFVFSFFFYVFRSFRVVD